MTKITAPDWAQIAYKIGIPSVIALGLTWFLASTVNADLMSIGRTLDVHVNDTRVELVKIRLHLQPICGAVAQDEGDRAQCRDASQ